MLPCVILRRWVQHGAVAFLGRYRNLMAIFGCILSRFAANMTGVEISQPCFRECHQSWGLLERHIARSISFLCLRGLELCCLLETGLRRAILKSALVTYLVARVSAARRLQALSCAPSMLHTYRDVVRQAVVLVHTIGGLTLDKHSGGPSAKLDLLPHA